MCSVQLKNKLSIDLTNDENIEESDWNYRRDNFKL